MRADNAEITEFDDDLRQLVQSMFEVMYEDDGMGLAAPQVGINKRLMVFNADSNLDKFYEQVFINPVVVSKSSDKIVGMEGCLSFPRVSGRVSRHRSIVVSYQDINGQKLQTLLKDDQAIVFQHEYDHLDKVRFWM